MKKSLNLEVLILRIVLLRILISILCVLIAHSRYGLLAIDVCDSSAVTSVTTWCKFCDAVLNVCGSSCFNKTFHFQFRDWQLYSPALLSSLFPVDHEENNYDVKRLFSRSVPTPFVTGAQLAGLSEDVISNILDLELEDVQNDTLFVEFVSGELGHRAEPPLSHRYGGHQFGLWAGQLGDGRAHLIGEYVSHQDGSRWELQLKGSGKTPYSRDGDGRAVLRSSVREFLASEAMYHLGQLYLAGSAYLACCLLT